jgi:NAD(P)-dependent dehydrogenase (short-subunit alcohol dehydrogenase family)
MSNTAPVWFISGCTAGFGLELVRSALRHGLRVVATGRSITTRGLDVPPSDHLLLLDLDVAEPAQIQAAVDGALARFGRIDVLVNNAGYGYQSSVEEGEDDAIRRQFEVKCCRTCARSARATSSMSPRWPASSAPPAWATTRPPSTPSKAGRRPWRPR